MSSKLASGLPEASRDALEALVAMGDTSVPGIEMSDLNDGDIMANTRENVNNTGQFQFVYVPTDGSDPIESDWISQDHKKKVILGWCEGVKSAIISRGQAGMQAANEAALEAKLKARREEDMEAEAAEIAKPAPAVSRPVRAAAAPSDPTAYVYEQLEIAEERLNAAQTAQNDINREVIIARKDVAKWKTLAAALDSSDDPAYAGRNPAGQVGTNYNDGASRPAVPMAPAAIRDLRSMHSGQPDVQHEPNRVQRGSTAAGGAVIVVPGRTQIYTGTAKQT